MLSSLRLVPLTLVASLPLLVITVSPSAAALIPADSSTPAVAYTSPYQISNINSAYTTDIATRIASYSPAGQSPGNYTTSPTPADWYDLPTYGNPVNASYGPSPYTLAQPTVPSGLTGNALIAYYQQRVIASAQQLINTPYQHHHLPGWNPYANGFTTFPLPNPVPTPNPVVPAGEWPWNIVSSNASSQQYAPVYNGSTWVMTPGTAFPNPYLAGYGLGAQGIDCSDLSTLDYSVGAGIYMNSAVGAQGVANAAGQYSGSSPIGWNNSGAPHLVDPHSPTDPLITPITPQFFFGPNSTYDAAANTRGVSAFNIPGSLDSVVSQLQPGDLLYITNDTGPGNQVTHVVMWLGQYSTIIDPATGGELVVPLVISSHDNTPAVFDANSDMPGFAVGNMPPPGVQILPFAENNWFYSNFSHAMRVLPTPTPTPTPTPEPAPTVNPTPEPTPTATPSPTATPAPTPSPTATPIPSPSPNPSPTATIPGVTLVGNTSGSSTPPRTISRTPADTIRTAPSVTVATGRPLAVKLRVGEANDTYSIRIKADGRYWNVGTAVTNENGVLVLPPFKLSLPGNYVIAITNTATRETSYMKMTATAR